MTLNTKLRVDLQADLAVAYGSGASSYPLRAGASQNLRSGTGVSQADKLYQGRRTLAASASEDLDLAGSLLDAFGATITFVKVKGVFVQASESNMNSVVLGGAVSNTFVGPFGAAAHTIAVAPGDVFLATKRGTGWTVTAATGDLLHVANSGAGTSVTYDITIWGTSA